MGNELKIRVVFDTGQDRPDKPVKQIEYLTGSLRDLESRLKEATKARDGFLHGTPQWESQNRRIINLNQLVAKSQAQVNSQLSNSTRAIGSAAQTMQALNYTVRDAPYFFKDFSLGILAVGNNLNPLIDGLIRTKQAAEATGTTLRAALMSTLAGPGGLILAFSFLVTVLQAVTFAMAGTKDETEKTKDKIKELRDEIKQFSEDALRGQLFLLESRQQAVVLALTAGKKLTEEEQKQALLLQAQVDLVKERLNTIGDIEGIENKIRELELERKELQNTGLGGGLISPHSKERLQQINNELERLRQTLNPKSGSFTIDPISASAWDVTKELNKLREEYYEELEKDIIYNATLDAEKRKENYDLAMRLEKQLHDFVNKGIEDNSIRKYAEIRTRYDEIFSQIDSSDLAPGQKTSLRDRFSKAKSAEQRLATLQLLEDERKEAARLRKELAEGNDMLNQMERLSQTVSNALVQAMSTGTNAVEALVRSLKAAVVEMIVMNILMQAMAAMFGVPSPGAAPGLLPSPTRPGGLNPPSGRAPIPDLKYAYSGGGGMDRIARNIEDLNMNMMQYPVIVNIIEKTPGLKFTKEVVRTNTARLDRGNIVNEH